MASIERGASPMTDKEKIWQLAERNRELEESMAVAKRRAADVLVVIHPDGYVEALSRGRNVKVVSSPQPDDRAASERLRASLSKRWQEVLDWGKLRSNGQADTWTRQDRINEATRWAIVSVVETFTTR